jgi:hypothetical protein
MLRSTWRFLVAALQPFATTVGNLATGGSVIGALILAHVRGAGQWPIALAIVAAIAVYLAFAGARLQHKIDSGPRLVFRQGNLRPINELQSPPVEALTLGIANEPRYPNELCDAENVRAELSFYGIDIPEIVYERVPARWANSKIPGPNEPATQDHMTLYRHGGVESIDICTRAGFNDPAWVYTTAVARGKQPMQSLPIGRYRIEVRLFGLPNTPVGHYELSVPKRGSTVLGLRATDAPSAVKREKG